MPYKDSEKRKEYLREYQRNRRQRIREELGIQKEIKLKQTIKEKSKKQYYREKQLKIELLGGKCVICGCQDNLEINHKDVKDTELRRITNKKKGCRPSVSQIKSGECNVELLCKSCHHKWSCAQRKAAFQLLANLSLEEQIKLTRENFF